MLILFAVTGVDHHWAARRQIRGKCRHCGKTFQSKARCNFSSHPRDGFLSLDFLYIIIYPPDKPVKFGSNLLSWNILFATLFNARAQGQGKGLISLNKSCFSCSSEQSSRPPLLESPAPGAIYHTMPAFSVR